MSFRRRIPHGLFAVITLLVFSFGANAQATRQNAQSMGGGITIENVSRAMIQQLDLRQPYYGVVVTEVDPSSEAGEYGLLPGDVIERVNTDPVENVTQLKDTLWRRGLDPVLLQVNRNGTLYVFTVSLR